MPDTLLAVMDQYAERLRRVNRTESTQQAFASVSRSFKKWIRDNNLSELTPWLIEEYLDTKNAPATKRLHLKFVRAAINYAQKRGIQLEDPTTGVELPALEDRIPRIIPIEELKRMKDKLVHEQDVRLFYLLAYTGMRRNEIRGLRREQCDLGRAEINVVGKGRKLRTIPIHPALGENLQKLGEENVVLSPYGTGRTHLSSAGIQRRVTALTGGRYGAHDFRRTVATSLYINNVPTPIIDRIMGWATHGIGEKRYLHVAGPNLQSAILRLYADRPLG